MVCKFVIMHGYGRHSPTRDTAGVRIAKHERVHADHSRSTLTGLSHIFPPALPWVGGIGYFFDLEALHELRTKRTLQCTIKAPCTVQRVVVSLRVVERG